MTTLPMPPDQAPPPPATAPPTELDARRELAREFRIDGLLENASTPIAYVARDGEDRALTIKVVPLNQVGGPPDRALAAIEAAGRLDHPHIVPTLYTGTTAHFLWYATRHVEGRSLANVLATLGPLDLPACLRIASQVASALDYANGRGLAREYERAHFWLSQAALSEDEETASLAQQGLASITPAMSDSEKVESERLSTEYRTRITASAHD